MEKLCNIKSLLRPLWPHQILAFRLFTLVEFCTFPVWNFSGRWTHGGQSMGPPWSWLFPSAPCPQLVIRWMWSCILISATFYNTSNIFKLHHSQIYGSVWKMVNTMEYQQNDPKWSNMIQNAYISMWENDEHPLDLMATWLCPWRLRPFHQALSFGSSAAVSHHAVVIFLLRGGRRKTHLLNWWYSCPWKLGGWCSKLQSRILSFLHIVESVSWGCH